MDRRRFIRAAAGSALLAAGRFDSASGAVPAFRTTAGSVASRSAELLRVNGARLAGRLSALAEFGRNADGGIDRIAYSDADRSAREWLMNGMRAAGLDVRIDTAGNIIGRRAGRDDSLASVMTGSHIDSVPGGGNFDGQVGSMGALEAAQTIIEQGVAMRRPLEVIVFQNEENGKVGSKAIRGQDPATYLDLMTHSGRTIRDGIVFIGGDPNRLGEARRKPGDIAAFLELHIEQGAVLDQAGIDIGIVEGIVGIKRWAVTVDGFANHAGTTPMDQRQDALLAAARFIDAVHRIARSVPGRHVATVGTIDPEPGAPNVIAGRTRLTLEMRDLDLGVVDAVFDLIRGESDSIARDTRTSFSFSEIYKSLPAQSDQVMRDIITRSAQELDLTTMSMPSGAGHDAQEMAQLAPMGMIFVPSEGGISHSPREFSEPTAIERGANVLVNAIVACDSMAG